jgi:hypothetical protein
MYALDRSSRTKGIRKSICQFSMIIDKSNLASVCKAMPKQDDDIFEFNPTSFWRELVEYQHKEYISIVDEDSGKNVLIPVSKLETKKK